MYNNLKNLVNNSVDNFKRVLICTPSLSYGVSSHYATSLSTSSILCYQNKIILDTFIINGECILPIARNKSFKLFLEKKYDDMVFIDSDQSWDPRILVKILKSNKKVIGVPVPIKNENENRFNFHPSLDKIYDKKENMITVERIGTGFLKLNKEIVENLNSISRKIIYRDSNLPNICEYNIEGDNFIGEDYVLCEKIKSIGYKIWITQDSISQHHGHKIFYGDLEKYINSFE